MTLVCAARRASTVNERRARGSAMSGAISNGAHTAVVAKYGGTNASGSTPTMVRGRPSSTIDRAITFGSACSELFQNVQLITIASGSSLVQMRPSAGVTPSSEKYSGATCEAEMLSVNVSAA